MPFYQYSVSNSQGQMLEGTLQANTTDAARLALANAGYVIHEVRERLAPQAGSPQQAATTLPPTRPSAQSQPPAARPYPRQASPSAPPRVGAGTSTQAPHRPRAVELSSSPQINKVTGGKNGPPGIKTKKGRDRDLYFLFTQLGSYFRSGINPAQALNDLTGRTPERYHDSMRHAAQVVSEGGRMSDALENYPYLYPPDVIGVIRAGETAGFMPEAMDEIAQKMEASNHIKRRLFYFQWMFIFTVLSFPLILGVIEGSLGSIKEQDQAGGSLPIGKTLGAGIGSSLRHDMPVTLLAFGALWAFWAWFHSMRMRGFRHRLVLRTPVLAGRARAEAAARFTWALGMISRGGVSPQSNYLLALQSVPNLAIRKHLEVQGKQMTESEKLSSALRRTNILPFEYGAIVETGEITGSVPQALESVYRATDADFQAQHSTTVFRSSIWLYIVLGVVILFASAILLTKYYGGLITTILGD